jgi:hypothetical protein
MCLPMLGVAAAFESVKTSVPPVWVMVRKQPRLSWGSLGFEGVVPLRVVPPRVAAIVVLCHPCAVVMLAVLASFCPSFALLDWP